MFFVYAFSTTCRDVIDPVTPSISIIAAKDTICHGSSVNFIAKTTNEGSAPIYQWMLNGLYTGVISATYSSTTLENNDIIFCSLTNNDMCVTAPSALSNSINIHVTNTTATDVIIDISDTLFVTAVTLILKR